MNIFDLFERRMDGHRQPLIEKLEIYCDDPDVFVTFTDVLKLGVNPRSHWDDPIGIYAYPVREMYEQFEQRLVPYAGSRRYAYIFRSAGEMLELQQYDEDDLDSDIHRMEKQFWASLIKKTSDDDYRSDPQAYWEHLIQSWRKRFGKNPPVGFWEITERTARHIVLREPKRDLKMVWNSIIRACGYDAVCDRGDGYISEAEPTQAVFLNTAAIVPLEAAVNDLTSSARP